MRESKDIWLIWMMKRKFTDVNDVPFGVDHYVSVVTIFDLQKISNHRIGGHCANEIAASSLKFLRRFIAILMQEILVQTGIGLSTQLITRFGIRYAFNDTALKIQREIINFIS